MSEKLLENGADVQDYPEKITYQRYVDLGGIINETDYNSALSKLEMSEEDEEVPDKHQIAQAENMAKYAGIELSGQNGTDRRVKLYSILRSDVKPKGQKYHHSDMADQRIFVEALRMWGDIDSVNKMIEKYPNISFTYKEGDDK